MAFPIGPSPITVTERSWLLFSRSFTPPSFDAVTRLGSTDFLLRYLPFRKGDR